MLLPLQPMLLCSNCTLLELKHQYLFVNPVKGNVRIAPYWNWNLTVYKRGCGINFVRIAPYWNWNSHLYIGHRISASVRIAPYWNWNFHGQNHQLWLSNVRIAPYWNWNLTSLKQSVISVCSNCTLLELKLLVDITAVPASLGSNCTLLELKLWWRSDNQGSIRFELHLTGIET